MDTFGYVFAVFMGITLGLVGAGGAIMTVPILVYLFQIDPIKASGYSLFIVGIASAFGSIRSIQAGTVDFRAGVNFAVPSFLGVLTARTILLPAIPDPVLAIGVITLSKSSMLMLTFAGFMVVAAFSMLRGPRVQVGSKSAPRAPLRVIGLISCQGLAVGLLAGFVGAGGGFMIIPGLVILLGLPMKRAVATSLFIIALQSLFGFLGELQINRDMPWSLLGSLTFFAVLGISVGTYLNRFVPEGMLRKGFGWFVLLMGSTILWQQLAEM